MDTGLNRIEKTDIAGKNHTCSILEGETKEAKVWLSIFMMILLVLLLPRIIYAQNADEELRSGDFSYVFLDNGYEVKITNYEGDWSLSELYIPTDLDGWTVVEIGEDAFGGREFENIIFTGKGRIKISGNAFAGTTVKSFTVPNDHENLAVYQGVLFDKEEKKLICYPCNKEETSYEIPNGIEVIGQHAFFHSQLEEIMIPGSVTQIQPFAFAQCEKLADILFRDNGIQEIGDYTFLGCNQLKSIYLPDSLCYLDEGVFSCCQYLEEVHLGRDLKRIGPSAFEYCDKLQFILIPEQVSEIDAGAFDYCCSLEEFIVAENNPYFEVVDGALYGKKDCSLIAYPLQRTCKELKVKEGTVCIYGGALLYSNIEHIILPESLGYIGKAAINSYDNVEMNEGLFIIDGNGIERETTNIPQSLIILEGRFIRNSELFQEQKKLSTLSGGLPGLSLYKKEDIWRIMDEIKKSNDQIVKNTKETEGLSPDEFFPLRAVDLPIRLNIQEVLAFEDYLFGKLDFPPYNQMDLTGDWLFICNSSQFTDPITGYERFRDYQPSVYICTIEEFREKTKDRKLSTIQMRRGGIFYSFDINRDNFRSYSGFMMALSETELLAQGERPTFFLDDISFYETPYFVWTYLDEDGIDCLYFAYSFDGGEINTAGGYVLDKYLIDGYWIEDYYYKINKPWW